MAWQETNVQDQKELFIKAWLSGRYTKTALCGRFGRIHWIMYILTLLFIAKYALM